jgi:hypothetical protein
LKVVAIQLVKLSASRVLAENEEVTGGRVKGAPRHRFLGEGELLASAAWKPNVMQLCSVSETRRDEHFAPLRCQSLNEAERVSR